jgi:hypothetical protein
METRKTYQIEHGRTSLMTDAEAKAANKVLRAKGLDKRWVPIEKVTHCPFAR